MKHVIVCREYPPAPGGGADPAVVARGTGADLNTLHGPDRMPGTSAIADLINRNVRKGRHHA